MDKIKKSSKKISLSKFKMKTLFAKNAFGGHYVEKILGEERLSRKFFQTNNWIRIKYVLKLDFNLM